MAADPLTQVGKNTTTLEREVVILENKTDITSLLTYEDIEKEWFLTEAEAKQAVKEREKDG